MTYIIGVIGAAWFLAQIGPRILGVDLAAECRAYEAQSGGSDHSRQLEAWRRFDVRTFQVRADSPISTKPVQAIESMFSSRFYVDRVSRGEKIESAAPDFVIQPGDKIAVAAPHEALIEHASAFGTEIAEARLVPGAADVVDVVVTQKRPDGMTLEQLAAEPAARGVFLREISRSGVAIPKASSTRIQRGDVLTLVGAPERTREAIALLGVADRVSDATDMVFVGLGIVLGAVVGIPAVTIGALQFGLSESVGVLLGGLFFGWLRTVWPVSSRIPAPSLWLFESLGLTGFVTVVGLSAGPDFVAGLKSAGLGLVVAAAVILIATQTATLLVGKYLFGMHPGILLGVVAGAGTATPALAAIQEVAKSTVPTLGYGVSYAVGNVFLALWGAVIVLLLS